MRRRPKADRASRRTTAASHVARELRALHAALEAGQWPALEWRDDPVGFWRKILPALLLLEHQEDIMRAVVEHPRVAVSAGQKIGKTFVIALIVWWFWSTRPKARVTLLATTGTQVDNVIWDEIRNVYRMALAAGVDLLAGGSTMAEDFHTGVESPDGRTIRGLTVSQVEAAGGISGEEQLFVVDEASSASEKLAHALIGNTAGGGKQLWTSNPTRAEGPFFDAFHAQKAYWKTFQLSSADIAEKVHAGGRRVPGVATKAVLDEWRGMFGEKSIFWLVRVLGQFVTVESGKIVTLHKIAMAQKLWGATTSKPEDGLLCLGVDVAGEGEDGDDWGFCLRRGYRVIELQAERMSKAQAKVRVRQLLRLHRRGDERPRVIIDGGGKLGSEFLGSMLAIAEQLRIHKPAEAFDVHGVFAHTKASRLAEHYMRTRDELWARLAEWIGDGGAIPPDYHLEAELHAASWVPLLNGKLEATPKPAMRRVLGRSPDRADALALSVWEPDGWRPDAPAREPEREPVEDVHDAAQEIDQHDGADWAWQRLAA